MNLLRAIRRLWTGRTIDAERAAEVPAPPGGWVTVERPSSSECRPDRRCETCRRLGTLPWAEGER